MKMTTRILQFYTGQLQLCIIIASLLSYYRNVWLYVS